MSSVVERRLRVVKIGLVQDQECIEYFIYQKRCSGFCHTGEHCMGAQATPREQKRRRFTLMDLITSIAVSALIFYVSKTFMRELIRDFVAFEFKSLNDKLYQYGDIIVIDEVLISMSCIFVSLFPPRPALRRMMRRPGFVACTAIFAYSLCLFFIVIILFVVNRFKYDLIDRLDWCCRLLTFFTGPVVVVSWTMLCLGGRWKAERTWVDHIGISNGAVAILICILHNWLYFR